MLERNDWQLAEGIKRNVNKMLKAVKRIYHYITSTRCFIADFIWQLDADVDALNAMIIEATKEIRK